MACPADPRGEATSGVGRATESLAADRDELLVGIDRRTSPWVVLEVEMVGAALRIARVAHMSDLIQSD